ncbi:MAG: MMPL family transporter, partial [Gammaproteobacteria bacterium]
MQPAITGATERAIDRVVAFSLRFRVAVLVAVLLATAAVGHYSAANVGINTDTEHMLSERLPWRQAYTRFKQAFPYFHDVVVVVVDGATPDLAQSSASALARALAQDPAHFEAVFHPADDEFLRRHQLLYLDEDALEDLADALAAAQALLGRLAASPDLPTLLDLLEDIVRAEADELPATAAAFVDAVATAVDESLAGNAVPMSWQTLLGGGTDAPRRVIFTVRPHLDFAGLLPAGEALQALRDTAAELGLNAENGLSVRLTGAVALADDELRSVIRGAERAGALALVMVAGALLLGLRSIALVVATLVTLITGLVLTAGFATLAVGTLNMISVAFAVLYVGLGVDFAIHLCLRYRELAAAHGRERAIAEAARHIGPSIVLCAGTTAIGFFAFILALVIDASITPFLNEAEKNGKGLFVLVKTSNP